VEKKDVRLGVSKTWSDRKMGDISHSLEHQITARRHIVITFARLGGHYRRQCYGRIKNRIRLLGIYTGMKV